MIEKVEIKHLSAYINAPIGELRSVLEQAATKATDRVLVDAVGGLVLHRTLRLLREESRQQILAEGIALDEFLYSAPGEALKAAQPDLYWGWVGLSALLGEAARRSDRGAVESILGSQSSHGRALLELLAERGGAVRRGDVRVRLGLSESHLSHVLRDLAEADLIERTQVGREVALKLGPVGRDMVQRSLLPEWVRHLADLLSDQARGEPLPARDDVETALMERGAPSRLVVERLAEALTDRGWTQAAHDNAHNLQANADLQVQVSVSSKVLLFTPRVA